MRILLSAFLLLPLAHGASTGTNIGAEPRERRHRATRQESLQRVEVTLFWRGDAPWTSCPSEDAFRFRCVGVRFGGGRWQLHLAQTDRRLPGMSTGHRRELIRAIRLTLASATGLAVVPFADDLILEPV